MVIDSPVFEFALYAMTAYTVVFTPSAEEMPNGLSYSLPFYDSDI
jgi:hypothetical protein